MFYAEPPRSRFDVQFTLGKIPVRIHPYFWLVGAMLGFSGSRSVLGIVLWTVAMLVSLIVHEFGHALVARAYGWPPHVVLYGMGGLAIYTPTHQKRLPRALISFAGPGAGFILGALILAGTLASGHSVLLPGTSFTIGSGVPLGFNRLGLFVNYLLFMNIFWGLINLAPIQPLDGGSIAQTVLEKFRPRDALGLSLKISIAFSIGLAIVGMVVWNSHFMGILFAILAFQSWQMLQRAQQHGWA